MVKLRKYLYVNSEILEAWDEQDEEAPPYLLPRGGYFRIVKSYTIEGKKDLKSLSLLETNAPKNLFWIRFGSSKKNYLVAPNWWQYSVVESLPDPITSKPKDEKIANAMYKLVRITDE